MKWPTDYSAYTNTLVPEMQFQATSINPKGQKTVLQKGMFSL